MHHIELQKHIIEIDDIELYTLKQTLDSAESKKLMPIGDNDIAWFNKIYDKLPLSQENPPHIIELFQVELIGIIELFEQWISNFQQKQANEKNPTTLIFMTNNVNKRIQLLIKLKLSLSN